jgi:DedD protein
LRAPLRWPDQRLAAEGFLAVKEQTRYRVTGSLLLLALAVIFLPMLFDGSGLPPVELDPVEPPPVTAAEVPDAPETERVDETLIERVDTLASEIDEEGFRADSGTRIGEPVLREPAHVGAPPAATSSSEPAAEPREPRLGVAGPDTRTWAVQVASFADVENARVFRERLRADGYEAFLSTLRTGGDVRTRVAVGPLQSRTEASELQRELSDRYRVSARLMAFSI